MLSLLLCLSAGCDEEESVIAQMSESGGETSDVTAGDLTGTQSGEEAGSIAGEVAGMLAGDAAGMPAGEAAGMTAGEVAGMPAGDAAGMPAGEVAGMSAGEPAGMPAGDEVNAGDEMFACSGDNPAVTCMDTGCPSGQECAPSGDPVCVPSSCSCDEDVGNWLCTSDCGPSYTCQDQDQGCPDPEDEDVWYLSVHPEECETSPITCDEGETPFSNMCGCGCISE